MAFTVTGKTATGFVRANCRPLRADGVAGDVTNARARTAGWLKTKSAPLFAKDAKNGALRPENFLLTSRATRVAKSSIIPDDVGFLRRFVGLLQNACRIAKRGDLRRRCDFP